MAKEVTKKITLQIPAGKATPAPPVGTVLGPAGKSFVLNSMIQLEIKWEISFQ